MLVAKKGERWEEGGRKKEELGAGKVDVPAIPSASPNRCRILNTNARCSLRYVRSSSGVSNTGNILRVCPVWASQKGEAIMSVVMGKFLVAGEGCSGAGAAVRAGVELRERTLVMALLEGSGEAERMRQHVERRLVASDREKGRRDMMVWRLDRFGLGWVRDVSWTRQR